jgi:hypothetical protein
MDEQKVQTMAKKSGGSRKPPGQPGRSGKARGERDAVSQAIGSQLKALYDQVANEPVPDRFRQLLDRLAQEPGEGSGHGGS